MMDQHIGCMTGAVHDPVQGVPVPLRWFYPTQAAARVERFGPYEMCVAQDAAPAGDELALVVISHGGGGASLTYRDMAAGLARAGMVALLLEHPGNNRADNSLEGTRANLENRPRHLRLAVDAIFADPRMGQLLVTDRVAVIGHSMGGYTALAAAGGRPMHGPPDPISVVRDPRITSLILLAPACGWFAYPGGLAEVDLPILLRLAEKDALGAQLHAHSVAESVRDPAKVDVATVANAGHHAFQSPFPLAMSGPHFPPSQDPPGFDRPAYLAQLQREILAFLRQHHYPT
jgi:predicted dienelactone hydrolase